MFFIISERDTSFLFLVRGPDVFFIVGERDRCLFILNERN